MSNYRTNELKFRDSIGLPEDFKVVSVEFYPSKDTVTFTYSTLGGYRHNKPYTMRDIGYTGDTFLGKNSRGNNFYLRHTPCDHGEVTMIKTGGMSYEVSCVKCGEIITLDDFSQYYKGVKK